MPSMQTCVRAGVMVAVGFFGYKAWHLYGPTGEQVKQAMAQVVEVAQSALGSRDQVSNNAMPDPRLAAPASTSAPNPSGAPPLNAPAPTIAPATITLQADAPRLLPSSAPQPTVTSQQPPSVAEPTTPVTAAIGDRVSDLISHLQQLGAQETKLSPWGGGGQLYRFSCRAPLASAPAMTQHFESVAAEPAEAVQQVLAKVEAWRVAQRQPGESRY